MTTRPTPLLDSLLARLESALDERGSKTELAHVIAEAAGIGFQTAKNRLTNILTRRILPNGEDTLLLAAWLDGRPRHRSTTRTEKRRNA